MRQSFRLDETEVFTVAVTMRASRSKWRCRGPSGGSDNRAEFPHATPWLAAALFRAMMGRAASVLNQALPGQDSTTEHVRKPRAFIETQGTHKLTPRSDFAPLFQKGNEAIQLPIHQQVPYSPNKRANVNPEAPGGPGLERKHLVSRESRPTES